MSMTVAAQVYWLHVSYLQVAAAALRSGAQLTALLYLEHWCEEQLGACTVEGIDTSTQVLIARKYPRTLRETSARGCQACLPALSLQTPVVLLPAIT